MSSPTPLHLGFHAPWEAQKENPRPLLAGLVFTALPAGSLSGERREGTSLDGNNGASERRPKGSTLVLLLQLTCTWTTLSQPRRPISKPLPSSLPHTHTHKHTHTRAH